MKTNIMILVWSICSASQLYAKTCETWLAERERDDQVHFTISGETTDTGQKYYMYVFDIGEGQTLGEIFADYTKQSKDKTEHIYQIKAAKAYTGILKDGTSNQWRDISNIQETTNQTTLDYDYEQFGAANKSKSRRWISMLNGLRAHETSEPGTVEGLDEYGFPKETKATVITGEGWVFTQLNVQEIEAGLDDHMISDGDCYTFTYEPFKFVLEK